jgi:hypothetical protein
MVGWLSDSDRSVPIPVEDSRANRLTGRTSEPLAPSWAPIAIAAFLVLGCVLRIVRYGQNLPLWSDECFLAVNFIKRGYLDLLRPLDNGQIAPLLYLWVERFVLDLAGFSEWSLRLFPLLCGLCSLFLFWRLAGRTLGFHGLSALLAVGIFAVSVHPIRHAAEAKPYASDLLVALVLLVPAVQWLRRREAVGWLWALVGLAPPALLLSNPAVFVAGGIGLGLAVPAWRTRRWSARLAVGFFGLSTIGACALGYLAYGQSQSAAAIDGLREYWASSFPPVGNPMRLAGWLVSVHTGSAFAYPGGGARGASTATFLAFLVGAVVMVRRGHGAVVACLTAPFGLALLAATLNRYPYGTEARLMQFAVPSICLLAGLGAASALGSIRTPRVRLILLRITLSGLVVCGVVPQVVSSTHPYRMIYDHQSREFARRFWVVEAGRGALACAHLDYQIDPTGTWLGRKAWYLCNQMIYSPLRRGGRLSDGLTPTGESPLRCVVFEESTDSPRMQGWLASMSEGHTLRNVETHEVNVTLGEGKPATEHWRVFEFVPRAEGAAPAVAGKEPTDRLSR